MSEPVGFRYILIPSPEDVKDTMPGKYIRLSSPVMTPQNNKRSGTEKIFRKTRDTMANSAKKIVESPFRENTNW